jgi:hypothetical protein
LGRGASMRSSFRRRRAMQGAQSRMYAGQDAVYQPLTLKIKDASGIVAGK